MVCEPLSNVCIGHSERNHFVGTIIQVYGWQMLNGSGCSMYYPLSDSNNVAELCAEMGITHSGNSSSLNDIPSLLYKSSDNSSTEHKLYVENEGAILYIDFFQISNFSSPSLPASPPSATDSSALAPKKNTVIVGAIAGSISGEVLLTLLLAVAAAWVRRKCRRDTNIHPSTPNQEAHGTLIETSSLPRSSLGVFISPQ